MTQAADPVTHLSAVETGLHQALLRPRVLAIAAIAVLAGSGWLYLGLMLGAPAGDGALLAALCRPTFGQPVLGSWDLAPVAVMWGAMIFAMMLPTAGPMVVTYAELAETAAAQGERVVSPLVLTSGYLAVWLGFAVLATGLQWLLARFAMLDPGLAAASGVFSGAVFVAAGAYQFSSLKHACLTLCQRPFPFFFANWSTAPRAVFRLGLRQGLYCLGCCWAMMLVMFAVGAMNVVWMAVLGVVMGVEKTMATPRFSRVVGTGFVLIGILFVIRASAQE
jgi:predicted metal-binding membrane protein